MNKHLSTRYILFRSLSGFKRNRERNRLLFVRVCWCCLALPIMSRNLHPSFQAKTVVRVRCKFCDRCLCARGMKAILLADTKVELYSTDLPPEQSIQLIGSDYRTKSCCCRIKDVACLGCGCVVGYHVILPCSTCLNSCNNGHFWMFHADVTYPVERLDVTGTEVMVWGSLPSCMEDSEMRDDDFEIECFR